MSLHPDPAEMTPPQRRREIAGLLARGVRRVRERPAASEPPDPGPSQNSRESTRNLPPQALISPPRRASMSADRGVDAPRVAETGGCAWP
jgi:hypothetical protein